jgi:hypothetical protein
MCGREGSGHMLTGAEVDRIGGLPPEGGVGHHGVVLVTVESDEACDGLDSIERMSVQPLMA